MDSSRFGWACHKKSTDEPEALFHAAERSRYSQPLASRHSPLLHRENEVARTLTPTLSFTPNGDGLHAVSVVHIEKGQPKPLQIVNVAAT